MKMLPVILLCAIGLLVSPQIPLASVVFFKSVEDKADQAVAIVVGRISEVKAVYEEEIPLESSSGPWRARGPFTIYTLETTEVLKGSNGKKTFEFWTLGGTAGGVSMEISRVSVELSKGTDIVVFLRIDKENGFYWPADAADSIYIQSRTGAFTSLVPYTDQHHFVDISVDEVPKWTLEELREIVTE